MKKIGALLLCVCLLFSMAGCNAKKEEKKGVQVVATLFPHYDFAKEVVGDLGEVTLLLDPGMESHSFDPSTADMVTINKADVFVYTGPALETWVAQMTDSFSKDLQVVDLSSQILSELEGGRDQDSKTNEEIDKDQEADDTDHADHHHDVDPHIWTSPVYAMEMVKMIRDAVCEADPEHAVTYENNAADYLEKLEKLDEKFKNIVAGGKRKEIVHGGRFALYHFAKEYGVEWEAAYDTCTEQAEPSAKKIVELTEEIKEEKIPVIFCEELMEPKVAKSISEATGAQMLLLHSCHNVSGEDFEKGVTYLELMEQNANNLQIALN